MINIEKALPNKNSLDFEEILIQLVKKLYMRLQFQI